jgi:hypothetical protein
MGICNICKGRAIHATSRTSREVLFIEYPVSTPLLRLYPNAETHVMTDNGDSEDSSSAVGILCEGGGMA